MGGKICRACAIQMQVIPTAGMGKICPGNATDHQLYKGKSPMGILATDT
jgi:hypothetical protein